MDKNLHESGLSEFSCLYRELDSLELVNPIQTGGEGGGGNNQRRVQLLITFRHLQLKHPIFMTFPNIY